MVRCGRGQEILAEPVPNPKLVGLTGAYLYATAAALAAKGRVDDAKAQIAELEKVSALDGDAGLNRVQDVLAVAVLNAQYPIAPAGKKGDAAVDPLPEAAAKKNRVSFF